jgi:hypothetical protein
MLIAVLVCIAGIVVENVKWPQDRDALKARFVTSERPSEQIGLLVGLVLNNSVVRWLIAFAVGASVVLAVLEIPALQQRIRSAIDAGELTANGLDALLGLSVGVLMTALAITARWLARWE